VTGARPVTRRAALRQAAIAAALVAAVLVVGSNFVLVEVRLFGLEVQLRLGWALLLALIVGFAGGATWSRR